MPDTQLLIAFLASAAVFAYTPGPSTLYAAAQTIAGGRKQGLQAALGIHMGGYFHVAIVSLGVASLFTAVPSAYTVMKLVGSIYLCVLGINLWRNPSSAQVGENIDTSSADTAERGIEGLNTGEFQQSMKDKTLLQSALVEVLNPKTAIFYLTFLPQFTDPAGELSVSLQLAILGAIVNFLFSSADLICVFFAERVVAMSNGALGAKNFASRLAGLILVLLGINLLF